MILSSGAFTSSYGNAEVGVYDEETRGDRRARSGEDAHVRLVPICLNARPTRSVTVKLDARVANETTGQIEFEERRISGGGTE